MSDSELFVHLFKPAFGGERIHGVVTGIVTSLNDPGKLGRVRVAFPWLDDGVGSAWARIAVPMAGSKRGAMFMPEIDDEVLVAFEHGLPDAPYVVGFLWNGKDAPPAPVEGGKVKQRVLKSRAGHTIEFLEDQDGKTGHIRIVTAGGRSVLLSDDESKLELNSKQHTLTLDDQNQKLSVNANGSLEISCGGCKLSMSARGIELSIGGSKLILEASRANLETSALLTLKGGLVHLNPSA